MHTIEGGHMYEFRDYCSSIYMWFEKKKISKWGAMAPAHPLLAPSLLVMIGSTSIGPPNWDTLAQSLIV